MTNKKYMLILALANLFIVFMGVGLVIPVIPVIKAQMHYSGAVMGMMISIFAFTQLVFSPVIGHLSDKVGRKKMIVLGMLIFSLSELLFGLAQAKHSFYFSRALGGVAAALVMPAVTAYIADITTMAERSKAMGYVSASISGGFIIGPGLGGLLAHFGVRVPFFTASVLAFIGCLLSLFLMKESRRQAAKQASDQTVTAWQVIKNPVFTSLFVVILVSSFGLQAFESIYSIMANINFGFSISEISIVIMVSGIVALIFQLVFFARIIDWIGEIRLMQLTFFVSAVFIFWIAVTRSEWVVIGSTLATFLAFDLFRPAVTSYLSKHAGQNQGLVNGLNSTFTSFGNIIGPVAAGALFDIQHFLPYFVSAAILMATGLLALMIRPAKD